MEKFMWIEYYRVDKHGEIIRSGGTLDYTVTSIAIDGDSYKITSYNIYTKTEDVYRLPMDKYAIVINKYI